MTVIQNSNFKSQSQNSKVKTDLKERCYRYSISVIKFVSVLPENRIQQIITNQLIRSATSIGANVVEAKSASSKKDFIKYYEIALKSANETSYWLGLLKDTLNVHGLEIENLIQETNELSKILAASILTMKNRT